MEWSEEEKRQIIEASIQGRDGVDAAIRAAVRAVELAAARGGTMTAEEFDKTMTQVCDGNTTFQDAQRIQEHHAAQGARVAVLEAECAQVREMYGAAAAQRDDFSREIQNLRQDKANLEEANRLLTERRVAAAEGNRELVRRAQQAEAQRDMWQKEHAAMAIQAKDAREATRQAEASLLHANKTVLGLRQEVADLKERIRLSESRIVTLSAAGQGGCRNPNPLTGPTCHERGCAAGQCRYGAAGQDAGDIEAYGLLKTGADARYPQRHPHAFAPNEHGLCGARVVGGHGVCGYAAHQHRYPCSSTCTHDDARTPGHPERVKERSEAFVRTTGADASLSVTEAACYEQGAEAMRAACLTTAMRWAESERSLSAFQVEQLKTAIEGATP